jgi:hypothetical protein
MKKRLWEELIAYVISVDVACTAQRVTPPTFVHCRVNVLTSCIATIEGNTDRPTESLLIGRELHKDEASNNASADACFC